MSKDQETRIYQAWKRTRNPGQVWGWFSSSNVALFIGIAAIPVPLYLGTVLLSDAAQVEVREAARSSSGATLGLAVLAIALLKAGLIDRFLARQTGEDPSVRGGLRLARLLLAAVPLFGFYAVPAWRELLERRPRWAFKPGNPRGRLNLDTPSVWPLWIARLRRIEGISRWLTSPWVFLALYLVEILVLTRTTLWLGAEGSAGRGVVWVIAGAFHLGATLGMVHYFAGLARRANLSRMKSLGLCLLSLFWLLPVPLLPLAALLIYTFADLEEGEKTLGSQAYASRRATDRLPAWKGLKERLLMRWESAPARSRLAGPPQGLIAEPGNLGEVETHATQLYLLRSLTLPLETAWLVSMSLRFANGRTIETIRGIVALLAVFAFVLGLAGLMLVAALFFLRLLRLPGEPASARYFCARAFAFTQLGFAAGLLIGDAIHTRNGANVAMVAISAGALGVLIFLGPLFLGLLRPIPELVKMDERQHLLLVFLSCFLVLFGVSFGGTDPRAHKAEWDLLNRLTVPAPLLGAVPGIVHLDWLLRPYTAKRMFSRGLPWRVRSTLAFLTFTGLLPLGGLAVPAWIVIRDRGWLAPKQLPPLGVL